MLQNSSNAVPTLYFAKSGFQGYSCQHLIRRPTPFEVRFRIIGRHLGCGTSRVYKKSISFSHRELLVKYFGLILPKIFKFCVSILIILPDLSLVQNWKQWSAVVESMTFVILSQIGGHRLAFTISRQWRQIKSSIFSWTWSWIYCYIYIIRWQQWTHICGS